MDGVNVATDGGLIAMFGMVLYRGIDIFKMIMFWLLPDKWVEKIPGEVWLGLSMILGVAITMYFKFDAMSELVGVAAKDINLVPWQGQVATGVLVATSSNVVNKIMKKKPESAVVVQQTPVEKPVSVTSPEPIVAPVEISNTIEANVVDYGPGEVFVFPAATYVPSEDVFRFVFDIKVER